MHHEGDYQISRILHLHQLLLGSGSRFEVDISPFIALVLDCPSCKFTLITIIVEPGRQLAVSWLSICKALRPLHWCEMKQMISCAEGPPARDK
jgi:hypothetical protein